MAAMPVHSIQIVLPKTDELVYELVLLRLYEQHLGSDPLQFGFKKKSSCIHALFTFNETVKQ